MKKWILLIGVVFLLQGCFYSVQKNINLESFKTSKNSKTGRMTFTLGDDRYHNNLYENEHGIYTVYYDNLAHSYGLLGVTKEMKAHFDSMSELSKYNLKKVEYRGNNTYYSKRHNLLLKILRSPYGDVTIEYTNDQNIPEAQEIAKEENINSDLKSFANRYSLNVAANKIYFYPDDDSANGVNGKGYIKYVPKASNISKVLITGNFSNGRLVGSATVDVYGYLCVKRFFLCSRALTSHKEYSATDETLSDTIRRGIREVQDDINEQYSDYRDNQYSSSSSSSSSGSGSYSYEFSSKDGKFTRYALTYNNSYDGMIFYNPSNIDSRNYTITTIGVKHGKHPFINGTYFPSLHELNLVQCGKTNSYSIDEAIRKSVDCLYKGHY